MLVDAELPLEGAELFDELGPEAVVLGLVTLGLAVRLATVSTTVIAVMRGVLVSSPSCVQLRA